MVLFHQLIISPVSQMHAFPARSARRNPVSTEATIITWLKNWCIWSSSLQEVLLCGCLKEKKKNKDEKISLISSGHSTQDTNEENHWRSLWQKRRMNQMKAGPPMHQPPVWGGGGGGGGWKGERRDCNSSLTLLELGGTGCRSEAGDEAHVHIKSLNADQICLQRISNFYLLYVFTIFNLTVKCPALLRASQLCTALNRSFCKKQSYVISYKYNTILLSEMLFFPAPGEL